MPASDPAKLLWDADNLRRALQAAGVALWSWNVDNDLFAMDEQAFRLWNVPQSDEVSFEDLSAHIHPADRDRVRAAFAATRAIVGAYEIDFRIVAGDEIRWISARGLGSDSGLHERHASGVFLDVTGRKQAEEGHELLAGEMSHRVKNLLAIATGLTQITSRSTTTATEMAKELTARLSALGRAHDLVRPLPGHQGRAALLGDLLAVLLSPYDDMGAFSGRIRVAVPRMGVGEAAATAMALVIHELATNSLKYGALSTDAGTLRSRQGTARYVPGYIRGGGRTRSRYSMRSRPGLAAGCFVVPRWSDVVRRRKLPMVICTAMQAIALALLIYLPELSPAGAMALCFAFGAGNAAHMLAFSTAADVVPPERIGTSAAIVNGIMFIVGGLMIQRPGIRIGWGVETGIESGSLALAQYAALPLLLAVILALVIAFAMRETYPGTLALARETSPGPTG